MKGDRAAWASLLPLIHAFVDGKTIHHKDYDGRWKETNQLYDLLHRAEAWRIAGSEIVTGTWSVEYRHEEPGACGRGITACGDFTWRGSDQDKPPWPNDKYHQYSNERFTPDTETQRSSHTAGSDENESGRT